MYGLPTTPTDNIYKFMAISGLWLMFGFIALYVWIEYSIIQLEKEGDNTSTYLTSKYKVDEIERRVNAIENGNLEDFKLSWLRETKSPEDELNALEPLLEFHRARAEAYKSMIPLSAIYGESDAYERFKIIKRTDFKMVLLVLIVLMVCLTLYGFTRWAQKTQATDEKLKKLDIRLKLLDVRIKRKIIQKYQLENKKRES